MLRLTVQSGYRGNDTLLKFRIGLLAGALAAIPTCPCEWCDAYINNGFRVHQMETTKFGTCGHVFGI